MPPINRTVKGVSLFVVGAEVPDFNFEARNLTVAFRLGDSGSFPITATPVTAGLSFNASGTLAGEQTLKTGPVDFQGVSYPSLFFNGSLLFAADPVTIPADSASPLPLSTPLKLSGTLNAYHNNPFVGPPGPPVFQAKLKGHGHAEIRCSASHAVGATITRDLTSLFFGFI